MFLDKSKSQLSTVSSAKAVQRARAAGLAAAANASSAAQNAAMAAQQAANAAQVAAQQAATVTTVAAQQAAAVAVSAAQSAGETAAVLNKQVKVQVNTARKWAGPRLEDAADYTAGTVAPKVSSALRSAAVKVTPVEPQSTKRSALTWTLLGTAVAAGLGAAAAFVRYRYRAAIADSEVADGAAAKDNPSSPSGPNSGTQQDPNADTSANGRVTASGW